MNAGASTNTTAALTSHARRTIISTRCDGEASPGRGVLSALRTLKRSRRASVGEAAAGSKESARWARVGGLKDESRTATRNAETPVATGEPVRARGPGRGYGQPG